MPTDTTTPTLIDAHVTPGGQLVVTFDGYAPLRTRRTYTFVVVYFTNANAQIAADCGVPAKRARVAKATGNYTTAVRELDRCGASIVGGPAVILRRHAGGIYRVVTP